MGFLADKKILITGLLSNRSIAYGIAKACKREGAELAFTYVNDKLKDRVVEMANELGSNIILRCDVSSDEEIAAMAAELGKAWTQIDGVVHSIGFAPREALSGDYLDSVSREAFQIAHDISSYSFAALAKALRPQLSKDASLLTLSYLGAERAVPNYNVMGLAKASLEANVRYMAMSIGAQGVRVNGISAGPIKTLAAAGISGFSKILHHVEECAPLKRNVSIDEVGNVAAFLLSDLASAVTGEIMHVDNGYSTAAAGMGE
ncbi:enoyl-ACP reductase FabI [Chitinimonas sp.]|uniref:enoyl-ACP reductase FabI n=1 Tax=Chitinimonas sp. TaxID=1934313 RepID=UPI0035AE85C9